MKTTVLRHLFLTWAGMLLLFAHLQAQPDQALLRELAEDNQKSVDALALYPRDTRIAILEACQYPEILVKMNHEREKTAAAFRDLIENYPRATQEVLFDLTRYPGLIERLVAARESESVYRDLLSPLPANKREAALDVVWDHPGLIRKIDALNRTAARTFEDLTAAYPALARQAFGKLLETPEVLEILNDDLRFAIMVGDLYRSDPENTIRQTDSLNLAVAREHAQELDDWKASLQNDPEAQRDLEAAAREYADEYDYPWYEDDYIDPDPVVVEHHYYYHYPWWYGYPWWYPQPCWRPYPWWWDWGYYPSHHTIVVVGMPSWYFMDWYFDRPHHHHHYNHLSTHFVEHYRGHRRSGTSISVATGAWHDRNRHIVSDEWLDNKAELPRRLKEYGEFEEGRQEYNKRNPGAPLTQEEYLDKNRRKFPEIDRSREQAINENKRRTEETEKKRSEWAPLREPAPADKPEARPPRDKKVTPPAPPREQPARDKKPEGGQLNPPKEKAPDYHREKWNESKRERQIEPPKTQPTQPRAPKTQPSKPAKTTKTQPRSRNN